MGFLYYGVWPSIVWVVFVLTIGAGIQIMFTDEKKLSKIDKLRVAGAGAMAFLSVILFYQGRPNTPVYLILILMVLLFLILPVRWKRS